MARGKTVADAAATQAKKGVGVKEKKKPAKKGKTLKEHESNPFYQQDLIECFKQGYAQFSGKGDQKGTEEQRLAVRELCRSKGKE